MSIARYLSKLGALLNSSGQVQTSALAPNAVTAAKLAREGSAGQVLTSNGDGSDPSYQSLPAGGVTSLNGQSGAITNTSLYAIGSYVHGRPANTTTYAVNSTIAGSSLYATAASICYDGTNPWRIAPTAGNAANAASVTLINAGTWRCVSPAANDGSSATGQAGLWVRIS